MREKSFVVSSLLSLVFLATASTRAEDIKQTELYGRIKSALDDVRAIDTHDHLRAFGELPNRVATEQGEGMTLHGIWAGSYYRWINPLSPWPESGKFDDWWNKAQYDFDDARGTSFYRYLLPAFRDLYGIDFDTISKEQAADLNRRIFENYKNDEWLYDVVTRRANIELMVIDPYWARFQFAREYKFSVPLLNVTSLMSASHPDRVPVALDSPYEFAKQKGMAIKNLEDYLQVIDALFALAVESDAICLKSTQAYQRTLHYERVSRERAEAAFLKSPKEITPEQQKDFEDFMFWEVCRLSAKHDLPFQVHTGQARIQGSNPILLADVIEANPETKFILFHGGFPWVGETGVIAMRYKNVWIDSVWLPTLSYTMAKRAYQEWLEVMPSSRIMWGADTTNAEGIYAATEFTRQCLAEALAEKVERGELKEEHAIRIGGQILRENALNLFPKMRRMLWRDKEVESKKREER